VRFRSWFILGFTLHFVIFAAWWPSHAALAEEASPAVPEEIRELLSKGLTIYEIDQELLRLDDKEVQLTDDIKQVTVQAADQAVIVDAKRAQAGKILRSYYKGKRDHLWLLVLNADSFYEALQTYYYLSRIFEHEQRILQAHADAYRQLQDLLARLELDRSTLRAVRQAYIAQRDRLIALQEELDRELAAREDGDTVQEAIDALTHIWETKGLPVFKHYFNELARAIGKLPEEIIANGNMKLKNGRFVMTITDTALTDFFRAYNPEDFEHFTFSFAEDDFTAYGAKDDTAISIKGYYELDEKTNTIVFQLTRLVYNGYELPDTTIHALQDQFDLNFYPDLLDMPIKVQAQEVVIEDGELRIGFVLKR